MAPVQTAAALRTSRLRAAIANIENSIRTHERLSIFALLAVGLLVRIWHASGTLLNADEAMHFAAANQPSWWLTYRASSHLWHPPLLIFFLHVWRHLGTGELMLRLPAIFAGVAFCWLTVRWLSELFSAPVAWAGFLLALFLPSSIQLSTEVRQYALLLAFAMASAYLLERALAENSVQAMLLSGVYLWLALSSHFSAFLFAAALGVYAIWRMVKQRVPLRIFAAWELGQVVALGLGYFFYTTQFPVLQGGYGRLNAVHGSIAGSYLAKYYFNAATMNPVGFVLARTGGFFQFTFTQLIIGDLAVAVFVLGIAALYLRPRLARINSHQLTFLLLFPFAIACAAGLLHAYPYGGIRHCAFLLPFALAGISVGITWLCREDLVLAIGFAALIAALCNALPSKQFLADPPGAASKANMQAAVAFIEQKVPASEPIFTDPQSSMLLSYYLCEQHTAGPNSPAPDSFSYTCGGRKIIVARHEYVFTPSGFAQRWPEIVRQDHLASDSRVCIVQMGRDAHLASQSAPEMHIEPHSFGSQIQIFDLNVGQSVAFSPTS